jgi:hypothetical protein
MVPIRVTASGDGDGDEPAELWVGDDRLGVTVLYEGRVHLRIDQRADGEPWLIDTTALALALDELSRQRDTA